MGMCFFVAWAITFNGIGVCSGRLKAGKYSLEPRGGLKNAPENGWLKSHLKTLFACFSE